MANFHYQGRDLNGQKTSGNLEANNISDAVTYLRSHNIIPISIDPVKNKIELLSLIKNLTLTKVKPQELMSFCRQISTLISAGVPVIDALTQLAKSSTSKTLGKALDEIAKEIIAGKSLAIAMANYPKIFSPIFMSIVDIGENTGKLNEAFKQLSNYLEVSITNHRRLKTTTRYPITVVIAIIIATVVMNVLVIPKFKDIFIRFGDELPVPTKILIVSSNIIINYWQYIILGIIILAIAIPRILKIPKIRYYFDKYKLKIPIFGKIQNRIILAQFTWTLSLILNSGLPIIKGLILSSSASGNTYFTDKINTLKNSIEQGTSFYQAALQSQLFPMTVLQMIEIGEETGQLDNLLNEVSQYYDREIDYDIRTLNDVVEPVLLAMVGGMVLLLALGVYLPMWDLIKVVKF